VLRRLVVALVLTALVVGGSAAEAQGPGPAVSGAAGIGDPYFPEDGNGGIDVLSYAVHDSYRFTGRLSGWTV